MRAGIPVALVCIAIGVLYYIVPDFLKYGWRRKYPDQLKYLSTESYKKYMRKCAVVIIVLGCMILLCCLLFYFNRK
jgi:hypothetical protein